MIEKAKQMFSSINLEQNKAVTIKYVSYFIVALLLFAFIGLTQASSFEPCKILLDRVAKKYDPIDFLNCAPDGCDLLLHEMIRLKDWKVVTLLISRGADPGIVDSNGRSARSLADEFGHLKIGKKCIHQYLRKGFRFGDFQG